MTGRCRHSLHIPSIQSLLSHIDDGKFIDDGDSDSDDPRDDSNEDRDYVFGEDYSESEESSDDEYEGPAASTLPPLLVFIRLYVKYADRQRMKCIRSERSRCGISAGEVVPVWQPSAGI
ncbi:hypothetical protein E2C01_072049 [Portunus trituberculatus]|uniref:Uncharacterized protein n=1 Tax=Portunus trituberculatus TaxID=210409 RepID=A0A5B7I1K9_PORTR|nr:hypothetical protein [Portunus trituberculatus]